MTELYWVESRPHDADCFIFAGSQEEAHRFHFNHFRDPAPPFKVRMVVSGGPTTQGCIHVSPCFPTGEDLLAFGFTRSCDAPLTFASVYGESFVVTGYPEAFAH
jgi:hypothetical protein